MRDFSAMVVLLALAIVVAGYVLIHERFRFPFISTPQYTLYADLSTAQAVTPGQGQTVRVSGVKIGEITGVSLHNGTAVVQMQIDQRYRKLIHTDASALLRPRTGLKDMFLEVDPGRAPAPVAKPGWTIPVSNTMPDVDVDEILASLDSDSRAYLNLLVNGAGHGLAGRGGDELAQVMERFEPTHRDLARVNGAVAQRGADLQQLVSSLRRLNQALATKQAQIVSLVDSSAVVFRAFASQDSNISRAISDLPGTLAQTTQTLGRVQSFSRVLAPMSTNLLPAARALPAANAALTALARPSAPIVRDQIRPFVVAARPLVRNLRPAAINLAKATPGITKTFGVLNHLVNMLGYNPGNVEHGYLWWLAWLDHDARTLFSVQDANGDFRPLFLQASCATYTQLINSFNSASNGLGSQLESVLNLSPILTSAGVCPVQAAADQADYRQYEAATQQGQSPHLLAPAGHAGSSSQQPFDPALPVK
ncbi:MAG: MlaD family protein [Solirubrobacteraceae bacterium]